MTVNVEALSRMKAIVTHLPVSKLNLEAWVEDTDYEMPEVGEDGMLRVPENCGTTACVCGWAGLDPWFRERGFMTDLKTGRLEVLGEKVWVLAPELSTFMGVEPATNHFMFSHLTYDPFLEGEDLRDEVLARLDYVIDNGTHEGYYAPDYE